MLNMMPKTYVVIRSKPNKIIWNETTINLRQLLNVSHDLIILSGSEEDKTT